MSNSDDAENMGNARSLESELYCHFVQEEGSKGQIEKLMTSVLGFIIADYSNLNHRNVVNIIENPNNYCDSNL